MAQTAQNRLHNPYNSLHVYITSQTFTKFNIHDIFDRFRTHTSNSKGIPPTLKIKQRFEISHVPFT